MNVIAEQVAQNRQFSPLPVISMSFKKLNLRSFETLVTVSDFQLDFRNNYSTIDQVHRITSVIEGAFEERKYCPLVFLGKSQAIVRVWIQGVYL